MKKYKLLAIIMIAFTLSSIHAQEWIPVDLNTEENLNEVYFKSDNNGFIIGDNGTLYRTIDGGDNWLPITIDATHHLQSISFANDDIGYINGLKTTDGGETWSPQVSSEFLGLLYAITENRIIAGHGDSFSGDVYESNDGGETWEILSNPISGSTGMYNDIQFINETDGYLAAWYSEHLLKTTDGGLTWTEIVINEVDGEAWSSDDFRSVYFYSENEGLVTHENGLLKTVDAGTTWSEIRPEDLDSGFYSESVIALSTDHYILVGGFADTDFEKIYETTDGGNTWTAFMNINDALFDVNFNSAYSFAVGTNGTVLRKQNSITNIAENISNSGLHIYPNPSSQYLILEESKKVSDVSILTLNGVVVKNHVGANDPIDVSQLSSGIYLIQVTRDGVNYVQRFIKK